MTVFFMECISYLKPVHLSTPDNIVDSPTKYIHSITNHRGSMK